MTGNSKLEDSTPQVTTRVLVADDQPEALFALEQILSQQGFLVQTAERGDDALEYLRTFAPELALLDVSMPGLSGLEVTKAARADALLKYTTIILLTANDSLADVLAGFEHGADDYIKKPFQKEELLARMGAALRVRRLYSELKSAETEREALRVRVCERTSFANIIGKSAPMQAVFELIQRVKDVDVPVLVTGESGTGKELVASAIHFQSVRKSKPFVAQNCAAFNDQLLESELFGHVRGSFTGAVRDHAGLFEQANGGTLFLDEVGEMSAAMQSKLLRVVQDGALVPVGGAVTRRVQVRIIAATHRDLREMVKRGQFREDLYYRLNVVSIQLPPLRERLEDVPLILSQLLERRESRAGAQRKELSVPALGVLTHYRWPGNVRELQNEIERAWIMSGDRKTIDVSDLSPHIVGSNAGERASERGGADGEGLLKDALATLERKMIEEALKRSGGNKSEAARDLGISRSSLISKTQEYGLGDER